MAEIRWTSQALKDLESITEFIASDSPQYASLFAIDVMEAIERLIDFPQSGRVVPEFDKENIREILLGNYRIVYRVKDKMVEILTIHHGAKLFDRGKKENIDRQ